MNDWCDCEICKEVGHPVRCHPGYWQTKKLITREEIHDFLRPFLDNMDRNMGDNEEEALDKWFWAFNGDNSQEKMK